MKDKPQTDVTASEHYRVTRKTFLRDLWTAILSMSSDSNGPVTFFGIIARFSSSSILSEK
jgi:hypothetical protein